MSRGWGGALGQFLGPGPPVLKNLLGLAAPAGGPLRRWPGHRGEVGWVGTRVGPRSAVSSTGADFSHRRNVLTALIFASPKPSSAIHYLNMLQGSEEQSILRVPWLFLSGPTVVSLEEEVDSGGHSE